MTARDWLASAGGFAPGWLQGAIISPGRLVSHVLLLQVARLAARVHGRNERLFQFNLAWSGYEYTLPMDCEAESCNKNKA